MACDKPKPQLRLRNTGRQKLRKRRFFQIRPAQHLIATAVTSSLIYFLSRSESCFVISFLGGFFIDLDHLLDYYLQEGINLKLSHFYHSCRKGEVKYTFQILHSVEYIAILWLVIYFFKLGIFWISLGIGISQHMLFDFMFNRDVVKTRYFYFITLRALKGFRFSEFKQNDNA